MIFLVDNGFDRFQGVTRTLTANEEADGHEVDRLANGRRSFQDYWTTTTANAEATVTIVSAGTEAFDMLVLDRGHNLAGKQVIWECSADGFATSPAQILADVVIPTTPGAGHVDDSLGVVTEEGAWLKRIPVRAENWRRLRIPAMGVDQRPEVVGAWLGLSVTVDGDYPWAPDASTLGMSETVSSRGWRGRRDTHRERSGTIHLRSRPDSLAEAEALRWHLALYTTGQPMWIVPEEYQAERALLAIHPGGRTAMAQTRDHFYPHGDLPYVEHQALELTA